jgi:CubicO group peptidase (beta-lactamase class C family)
MKLFRWRMFISALLYILCFQADVLVAQAVKAHNLDTLFNHLYSSGKFNGNVLVAEKGNIIYQRSFGLANESTREKLTSNSIFELASVSKQFTATAIVILKEQGKLQYTDPIDKYIPELSLYHKVTIRNLLNHTCGLPDYMNLMDSVFDKHKIATNNDIIAVLAKYKLPLDFEPGTRYAYSNTGYALLATIIEKASKQNYGDYLQEHIFFPTGMKHTFVYTRRLHPKEVKNYAYGYVKDSLGHWALPDHLPNTDLVVWLDGVVGDGAVNSTTGDLLIWDRALKANKLVSQSSAAEMFTQTVLPDGKKINYGFGWGVSISPLFGHTIDHTGGWPGYITYIERDLSTDRTLIMLQNHDSDSILIPYREIRKIIYGIHAPKFIKLPLSAVEKFAGEYQTEKGQVFKIVTKSGKLYWMIKPDQLLELRPVSATLFMAIGYTPDVSCKFIMKKNHAKTLIVKQPETGMLIEARTQYQ